MGKIVASGKIESLCKHCGAKNKVKSIWGYGCPILVCAKCGKEYFCDQIREPAVEGLLPATTDPKYHLKMAGVMLGLAVLCEVPSMLVNGYYIFTSVLAFLLLLFSIYCVGMFFWVLLGFAKKGNEQCMRESEERLQNPEYVKKLLDYGYVVPSQYRMLLEETDQRAEEQEDSWQM